MDTNTTSLLTLTQAAEQVGMSRDGLKKWTGRGLDVEHVGRFVFVTPDALERFKLLPVQKGGRKRRKGTRDKAASEED